MIVLVTLEPNPPRAMPGFIEALELNSHYWRLMLRNVWASNPIGSVQDLYAALKPELGRGDKLLIAEITPDHAGWVTEEAVKWLRQASRVGLF